MKKKKFIRILIFIIICSSIFINFYKPIEFEDIWWHLSTGKWILENNRVPHIDPFPLKNPGKQWIHRQWLGSLTYYSLYQAFGLNGLKIFRSFIILFVLLIFWFYAKKKIPFSLLAILICIAVFPFEQRALLRPFLFSFIFTQIFLIILLEFQNNHNKKGLIFLPIIGVIWNNIHLGSFIYGNLLIFLFFFSSIINYLNNLKNNKILIAEKKHAINQIKYLGLTLLFYLLSSLITPYGIEGALFPIKDLFIKRSFFQATQYIAEFQSPINIFSYHVFWAHILFIIGIISLCYAKRNKFIYTLLFTFASFLFIYGARASTFYTLIVLYVFAAVSKEINFCKTWEKNKYLNICSYAILAILILLFSYKIYVQVNSRIFKNNQIRNRMTLHHVPKDNPTELISLLNKHKIVGNIFCKFSWGGYIIWKSYPKLRPFLDGRHIIPEKTTRFALTISSPGKYWPMAVTFYDISIAILNTNDNLFGSLIIMLQHSKDWQLIAIDGPLVLYVKKDAFDLPNNLKNFEKGLKKKSIVPDELINNFEQKLSLNVENNKKTHLKLTPDFLDIDIAEEGITLYYLGYPYQGFKKMMQSFDISIQKNYLYYAERMLNNYKDTQKELTNEKSMPKY